MINNTNKISKLDIIAVTLILLLSGTIVFYVVYGSIFITLYFLFGIFYYFKNQKQKTPVCNKKFIFFWMFYFILNYFFINSERESGIIPAAIRIMIAIGSFGIISKMKYSNFKYILLRLVALMAITSIIIYLLLQYNIISSYNITGDFHIALFHRDLDRLSGMYWEPGAYQIVLNITLLLYFNDIVKQQLSVKEYIMLFFVIIASILTQSTAAYIVLSVYIIYILALYVHNNIITFKRFVKIILLLIVSVFTLFTIFNSNTIQRKFEQKERTDQFNSYNIRKNDNIALLTMTIERPITGWGVSSTDFQKRSLELNNITSSNGVLLLCAEYGILLALYFIITIYNNLGQFKINLPHSILLILIIILNSFEVFILFPLMYIFYLRFTKE